MAKRKKTTADKLRQAQRLFERITEQYPSYNHNGNWIEGNRNGQMRSKVKQAIGNMLLDGVLKKMGDESIKERRKVDEQRINTNFIPSYRKKEIERYRSTSDRDVMKKHIGGYIEGLATSAAFNKIKGKGETDIVKLIDNKTKSALGLSNG